MPTFDDGQCEPGIYWVEVKSAETVRSKTSGDWMLKVKLYDLFGQRSLCDDNLMLQGKGAWMGARALSAMGISVSNGQSVEAADVIGKRVYVKIRHEEFNGRTSAKVDKRAENSHAGYWPHDKPPEGAPTMPGTAAAPSLAEDPSVPF